MANSAIKNFIIVSRIHRMDPTDSRNIDSFLEQYGRTGQYVIMAARFRGEAVMPEPIWDYGIVKKDIRVCPAWQVGENDPDVIAIEEDNDPIIPDDVTDPPVLRARQRLRKRVRRRRS